MAPVLPLPLQSFLVALADGVPREGAAALGGAFNARKADVGLDLVSVEVVDQTDGHARGHGGFHHKFIGGPPHRAEVQVRKPDPSDARDVP